MPNKRHFSALNTHSWEQYPREADTSYQKFVHYCDQGPRRLKSVTADHFRVSRATVTDLSKRWFWAERAQAWDAAREDINSEGLTLAERLQQMASRVPEDDPNKAKALENLTVCSLSPELRERELEHERVLEEFREEAESLGRRQMKIAKAMTGIAGNSVASMLRSGETLHPRAIPGFLQAAIALGQAAHHNWGRAIGVDRLLLQMEQAVVEMEQRAVQNAAVPDAEVIG